MTVVTHHPLTFVFKFWASTCSENLEPNDCLRAVDPQGRRAIQISGVLVSRAPKKPKYKPRNTTKIKSKLTDKTSITECIEFYRLAFAPGGPGPGPIWAQQHC